MNDPTTNHGIAVGQRIYVNRSLNFGNIGLIGFDMDHTLAPYNREAFEALAFTATLKKFIDAGYPEELGSLQYKPDSVVRGLIVDRARGNILKVNGHKYVKVAYHGYSKLTKEERYKLYNHESFKAQDFLSVDTFFALSEVQLFLEIVDYMDKNPGKIQKSFQDIYADLRNFIDLCHRDGSIKDKVLANPEKFFKKDRYLSTALVRLLDAGKSLFMLTNSDFEYTRQVMSYVLDGTSSDFSSWKDYWDIIIVGASKPDFFAGKQPFFEVIEDSKLLRVHDGEPFKPDLVYHGGNAKLFEKLSGYRGDEILYVGDHIYGDIIQSKGMKNWRTLLIVEELEEELPKLEKCKLSQQEIYDLFSIKESLDEEWQKLRSKIAANKRQLERSLKASGSKKQEYLKNQIEQLEQQLAPIQIRLEETQNKIKAKTSLLEAHFNQTWGQVLKVGIEKSRFAHQIASYACLYTSRVSNLRFYNPYKKFVSFHETLPHENPSSAA